MPSSLVVEHSARRASPGHAGGMSFFPSLPRLVVSAAALGLVVVGGAFWGLWPLARLLWPFPLTSGLFLAAISFSIAAPALLIALRGDFGAVRAGGVSLGTIFALFSLLAIGMSVTGRPELLPYAAVALIAVVGNVLMFRWGSRFPLEDERPMPTPVLWFFALSAILLIVPGVAALLGVDVMAFPQTAENLRWYGAIYAGAGAFFVWALLQPVWSYARLVLLAFLVYDLVVVSIFPGMLPRLLADPAAVRLSTWIYWGAVFGSTVVAGLYLFVLPSWRLWRPHQR
ncbi:MAG: hypothetical protein KatS3mg061_3151 [Dehalococcoidia bacterium]|nr:MAG: hypothetical protein KatS3mg061_3151 [Dehalococcoidia bacterium]